MRRPLALAILSDLHLEHSGLDLHLDGADMVAVVGDVLAPTSTLAAANALHPAVLWLRQRIPDRPVFYVPGNHDYEGTRVPHAVAAMRRAALGTNIQVLWNETADHAGVRFIGTPLWSDPRKPDHDDEGLLALVTRNTDLRRARDHRGQPLNAHWLLAQNRMARSFVARELSRDPGIPKIVLTHWAPSLNSQTEDWRKSTIGGYWASDHEDLVVQAHLWIHGHVHSSVDYRLGDDPHRGRVLSNPRGGSAFFNLASNPQFRQPFLVDVPMGAP